ncbi:hypothetical protein [Streptomyces sp. DSM 40907]|uniref:hypothetical protein n=1 Tax=Streptomyces kutzneri TaxID=3051179 RepID=UPI0028D43FE9|nr:hypothetical protein [Streptomyces sp. DSM 40907]
MATTPRSGSEPHGTPPASATPRERGAVERAEAVLVEQYPRLVRLTYLTLPPSLGQHTRVLLAHRAVQHALPRAGGVRDPGAPGGTLEELRVRVLRAALAPAGAALGLLAQTRWPGRT